MAEHPAPIGGATRVAAVIGSPVRHSRSPALVNAVADAIGLDANVLPLTPDRVLEALIRQRRSQRRKEAAE